MPVYPVVPPPKVDPVVNQDGAGNVVSPAILSSPCPSFPALSSQNGHFLVTSSQVVGVSSSFPIPHPSASIGVTVVGPSPCVVTPPPHYVISPPPVTPPVQTPPLVTHPQVEATPLSPPPGNAHMEATPLSPPPGNAHMEATPLSPPPGNAHVEAMPLSPPPGNAHIEAMPLALPPDTSQATPPGPPTDTSTLTGNVSERHRKEAISASTAPSGRLLSKLKGKKHEQKIIKAPSSDEESSESSISDSECEEYQDHWAKTKGGAIKDSGWEIANKITAFPIMVRQGRRQARKVTWHPVPFSELKELNKAAKEHGRGSHYFRHILEATFAAHTLLPHNIRNIIGCLLTPAEYLLWERNWKKQLATLVTAYANDTNKPNVILEQIAGEGNYLRPTDQFDIPDSALREIASAVKASLTPISTRTKNDSFGGSPQDEEDDFYSQIQVGTRRQL
ncbi:hypothetical protein HGM15179_021458, partial [Zosterops borbonicus]